MRNLALCAALMALACGSGPALCEGWCTADCNKWVACGLELTADTTEGCVEACLFDAKEREHAGVDMGAACTEARAHIATLSCHDYIEWGSQDD